MKCLFILLSFLLMACPKIENKKDYHQNSIQGKWKWVESSFLTRGMREAKISTPESTGYDIILEFKDTTVSVYQNKKLINTYQYEIKKMSPDHQIFLELNIQRSGKLVLTEFKLSSGPYEIKNGILEITGGYNDAGENQKYKRL
ncbi:MAG: hypothetical protein MK226_16365 [Saprospiraceae bacterium]|nr:hypothetical protein [Saprospiraceae bacterium]